MKRRLAMVLAVLPLTVAPGRASAQWTQVLEVPTTHVFSVWANGDTIVAGTDSMTHVSTDAGATWAGSVPVAPGVTSVEVAALRNGRIYAGTFGQGVFVSDDLGGSWTAYNQGLVGGIFDTQLYIADFLMQDDRLVLATAGDGAWARNLVGGGTWARFGTVFEPNQAGNMNAIAGDGSRMVACAGQNGMVFFRDPGDADWTLSWLNNVGIFPGLFAETIVWSGQAWVVGSNIGLYRSTTGEEPWTFVDPGYGSLFTSGFAVHGPDLYANFAKPNASNIAVSHDHGATWGHLETLPAKFIYGLAVCGDQLYAGRFDGLWRRSIGTVSVPPAAGTARFGITIAGTRPVRGPVRFRISMPEAGSVDLEILGVGGRRAAGAIRRTLAAGTSELVWDAGGLRPGVYLVRARTDREQAVTRLVRID